MSIVSGACSRSSGPAPRRRLVRAVDARAARARRRRPAASRRMLVERHERVLAAAAARRRTRYIDASLPSCVERELRREQRAERVAVGVLVGHDEEAVVRRGSRPRPPAGQLVRLSSGASSSISLRHADPALDRRIVFEGQLRRPLQPQLARDPRLEDAVRGRRARRASARACVSEPSTLTKTRAWRRSGDVSTPVTVTKPIRGSFSSPHRLGSTCADRLVHAAHPVTHRASRPRARRGPSSNSCPAR